MARRGERTARARFRMDGLAAGTGLCGRDRAECELAAGRRSHHRLVAYRALAPELDHELGNGFCSDARKYRGRLRVRKETLRFPRGRTSIRARRLMSGARHGI